jgi:hypothetical protein
MLGTTVHLSTFLAGGGGLAQNLPGISFGQQPGNECVQLEALGKMETNIP